MWRSKRSPSLAMFESVSIVRQRPTQFPLLPLCFEKAPAFSTLCEPACLPAYHRRRRWEGHRVHVQRCSRLFALQEGWSRYQLTCRYLGQYAPIILNHSRHASFAIRLVRETRSLFGFSRTRTSRRLIG